MKTLRTRIEGREVEAVFEFVNGNLWLHHAGQTLTVETNSRSKKKRKGAGASAGGGEIEAPMPGKITKIMKSAGDAVQKGDALIVMEAMKMEYTLKAEVSGTLAELSCAVGEQVALGQSLVRVEPAKAEA